MSKLFEIQVAGRLDATRAGPLEKEVEEAVHGGRYHIRLNLSRVVFLSSAGIRVLLKSYQMLRKLNGSFGVLAPSQAVLSVLELSGLMMLVAGAQPVAAPAASAPTAQPQAVEKSFESWNAQSTRLPPMPHSSAGWWAIHPVWSPCRSRRLKPAILRCRAARWPWGWVLLAMPSANAAHGLVNS